MKKHFLLLVMALMSLTGWAQTASFGEVAVGLYTYGDAIPTPQVKDSEGAILNEGTHYDVDYTQAYSDAACKTAVAKADMTADDKTLYYVKITGKGTYVGQQTSAYFTVKKAALTIAYEAKALDRTYGQDPIALEAGKFGAATGFVLGQKEADVLKGSHPTTYTTADNNAGTSKAVTFGAGKTADNYTVTYTATLDIAQKELALADLTIGEIADKEYDGTATAPKISVKYGTKVLTQGAAATSEVPASGDFYVEAGTGSDLKSAKDQNVTIVLQGNYKGTFKNAKSYTINPKRVNVTVATITKPYSNYNYNGDDLSGDATFEFSGIASADASSAKAIKDQFNTTAATVIVEGDAVIPGDYALTISGVTNDKGGLAANYTIDDESYIPATLTITKKELKLKAKSETKKVGEKDPTFTLATTTGVYGSYEQDKITGVTFTREKEGTAEGEEVGKYAITPSYAAAKVMRKNYPTDEDVSAYYTFALADSKGELEIKQGGIVVTIKDAEKFYGAKDPEFTYTVTGLQAGDEEKLGKINITRTKGEDKGTYSLTATVANPDPEKYESLTVSEGIFTINPAQLVFTLPSQTIAKEATAAALSETAVKVTGINNTDKATDLFVLAFNTTTSAEAGLVPASKVDGSTGKIANEDETYTAGYKATLDGTNAAVKAGNYVIWDAENEKVLEKAAGKLIVGNGKTKAIAFDGGDKTLDAIKDQAGETQDVTINFAKRNGRDLKGTRNWEAGKWVTMTLPFDISVADLSQAMGYAIVNVIDPTRTVVDGTGSKFYGKLTMKGGNGDDKKLKANRPFMLKLADDMDAKKAYNFGSQTIVAPDELTVDAGQGAKFVGTYAKKTVTKDDDAAIWFMLGNADGWAYIGSTSTATWDIVPFEAYIDMSALPAEARNITFYAEELDGSVTAIKSISTDKVDAKLSNEGWYNLNGVKLQGAPTQKGIYIQNGKKVIVK